MDAMQTLRPYADKILDFSGYSQTEPNRSYDLKLPVWTVSIYGSGNGSSHNGALVEAFCHFVPNADSGTSGVYHLRSGGRRLGIPYDFTVKNDSAKFRHAAEMFTYYLRQCFESEASGISFGQ